MRLPTAFDSYAERYDRWFDRHPGVFKAEVEALRRFMLQGARALEVGIGSGRFAAALGVQMGVDPAGPMLAHAVAHGRRVVRGVGEALPFRDRAFDLVLMTTVVCFLDDLGRALDESARVLARGGRLVVGMIDGESWLGRQYRETAEENLFYAGAHFRSVGEVLGGMSQARLVHVGSAQTLFPGPKSELNGLHVADGYGQGGFVAVCGEKKSSRA